MIPQNVPLRITNTRMEALIILCACKPRFVPDDGEALHAADRIELPAAANRA